MALDTTRIIHRRDLPLGGFAGIVETRLVMNPLLWKDAIDRSDISHGLGTGDIVEGDALEHVTDTGCNLVLIR